MLSLGQEDKIEEIVLRPEIWWQDVIYHEEDQCMKWPHSATVHIFWSRPAKGVLVLWMSRLRCIFFSIESPFFRCFSDLYYVHATTRFSPSASDSTCASALIASLRLNRHFVSNRIGPVWCIRYTVYAKSILVFLFTAMYPMCRLSITLNREVRLWDVSMGLFILEANYNQFTPNNLFGFSLCK